MVSFCCSVSRTRRSQMQEDYYYYDYYYWWGVEKVKEKVTEKWSRYSYYSFVYRFILYNNLFLIGFTRTIPPNNFLQWSEINWFNRLLFIFTFASSSVCTQWWSSLYGCWCGKFTAEIMRQIEISIGSFGCVGIYHIVNDFMRIFGWASEWSDTWSKR